MTSSKPAGQGSELGAGVSCGAELSVKVTLLASEDTALEAGTLDDGSSLAGALDTVGSVETSLLGTGSEAGALDASLEETADDAELDGDASADDEVWLEEASELGSDRAEDACELDSETAEEGSEVGWLSVRPRSCTASSGSTAC